MSTTASEARLPLRPIVAYALPMIGVGCTGWIISLYLMKFSTDVLLISPAAMGLVFGASRMWDAVSDPMAGYWSDRTRSRFGRRRPWLYAAALPLGLSLVALYSPPSALVGDGLVLWMAGAVLFYFTAQTCFAIPHAALGAEVTSSHHERTRVYAARLLFENIGVFAALGALFVLEQSAAPRDASTSIAIAIAIGTVALVVAGTAQTRERSVGAVRGASHPVRAFADVARNPHARRLLVVFFAQELGMASLLMVLPYFSQYILHTPGYTAIYLLCVMVPMTASVAIWPRVARRYGKKRVWLATNTATALAFFVVFFVGNGDWVWIACLAGFIGVMNGCGRMLAPSIQTDVIDYDELMTGERKEGAYFAAWNFVQKTAVACSVLFTGLALEASSFVPNVDQNESAQQMIRLLLSAVPMLCIGAGSALFLPFGLGESEHAKIQRSLEASKRDREALATA